MALRVGIARDWCRLMGLAPLMLCTVTMLVVRNQRTHARALPGRTGTSERARSKHADH
jgi:hypothetical protein